MKNLFKIMTNRLISLRKIPKRYLILIALVLIGGIFYFYSQSKKPQTIEYATIQRQDIKQSISASGVLTGKDTANLRFKNGGKIAYINVKQGDVVSAGQVLAGLDTQDLSIQLQQAENSLRDRQATVDKILDDIHLFQYGNGGFSNVGSENETETQRQARTTAEAARDNAVENVNAARRAFQDTVLVSPLDGVITQVNPYPQQNVSPADNVIQVVDETESFFDAEVDESDITKITENMNAEVTLNAYGDKIFKGLVSKINQFTKTTTSGSTVVIARIKLNPDQIRFTTGLNGQAAIITQADKNVQTIPSEALLDNSSVLVKKNDKYIRTKVTTGISSDTDTEITTGLKDNDIVVKNPQAVEKNKIINYVTN